MRDRVVAVLRWLWSHKPLVAGACVVGLAILLLSAHQTSRPAFCRSCHEMQYVHQTWTESSHREVSCEHCHYEAGAIGMIKTKIAGLGEARAHLTEEPEVADIAHGISFVPSERCLHCHEEQSLPDEFTYHLLEITHRQHLDRGAECMDCHWNVVHGGKAPFKNTPTMATCLVCHDGEEAPNRCGLCHQKLGEIKPALYNPAWVTHHKDNISTSGEDRCVKCHGQDFCRSCHAIGRPPSHTSDWVYAHETIDQTQRESCKQCHRPRGDNPEADFCIECHQARSAHGPGYIRTHPDEFQKEPDACGHCHQESFCADCHNIYMPHEPAWIVKHGPASRETRDRCRTCHTDAYCSGCHTGGRPPSHTLDFRHTHPAMARQGVDACRVCHTTDFCQQCHRQSPPKTHGAANWIAAHGGTALADRESCRLCHDSAYCASCHRGVSMPHPPDWLHTHPQSGRDPKACRTCHAAEFCEACHRGSQPKTHNADWPSRHGQTAKRSREACLRCHGERYCQTCHRLPMPHPADFGTSHGRTAMEPEGRYCGLCHRSSQCAACHADMPAPRSHGDPEWPKTHGSMEGADSRCALCHETDVCLGCHGLPMPHPENWMLSRHGPAASQEPQLCATCHDTDYCQTCHESTPPSSHEGETFAAEHGLDQEIEALCALCHGREAETERNACDTCHGGVGMPHAERFALEHKEQGSFDSDGPCLRCHDVAYCKVCHAQIPRGA